MIEQVRVDISRARKTIDYSAEQALRSNLYQNQAWMFYEILCNPESIIKMATAFFNRRRIGISIFWDYDYLPSYKNGGYDKQLGCFVTEDFRRNKIGTMLVERMNVDRHIITGTGVSGSRDFWDKVRPEFV